MGPLVRYEDCQASAETADFPNERASRIEGRILRGVPGHALGKLAIATAETTMIKLRNADTITPDYDCKAETYAIVIVSSLSLSPSLSSYTE